MKDVSREGTVPQVPVALGRLCSLEHLSAEAATGLLCWALRLQGSPASLGLGGAQFVTVLCFQSCFTLLQVGNWLCTYAVAKLWGYGGESASPRLEIKNKSGRRGCRRERLLGREQDVVPCAPGNTSVTDSGYFGETEDTEVI